MQIWPAIDIRGGNCMRLIQGDYQRETVYRNEPADMTRRWVSEGTIGPFLLDQDGAREGSDDNDRPLNYDANDHVVNQVEVSLQIGGRIRSDKTIEKNLGLGIKRFVLGTSALKRPDWFCVATGRCPDFILISFDVRDGLVAADGWQETSDVTSIEFVKQVAQNPIGGTIYTDISRDGMLEGPNLDAMSETQQTVDVPVIASGGVTTAADDSALAGRGLAGCTVGRALYEGNLMLPVAIAAAGTPGASSS